MRTRRLALFLACLLALLIAPAAMAEPIAIGGTACYAVTDKGVPNARVGQLHFTCGGKPAGYQARSLWVSADPASIARQGDGVAVMVHQSRFDKLTVLYL